MPFEKMSRRQIITPLLVFFVVMPFNGEILAGLGHGGAALFAALRDPAALIAGRSPGSRGSALIQTKPRDKVSANAVPKERVLAEVRQRPPVVAGIPVISTEAPQSAGLTPGLLAGPFGPGDLSTLSGGRSGSGFVGGIPNQVGRGGGGGGGGGRVPPITPTSPVPEPSTWMLMILGVFGTGLGLRCDRRRKLLHVRANEG